MQRIFLNVISKKTNLQDAFLGNNENKKAALIMNQTDFYKADLSYALIKNVIGDAIFNEAILNGAKIDQSDFSNASFKYADLTNCEFRETILHNADFYGAYNVPKEIERNLRTVIDSDGREHKIYDSAEAVTIRNQSKGNKIFFSMPGEVTKSDEIIIKEYKKLLEGRGFDVIFYRRDNYPEFGQLGKIKLSISESVAMVAFGFVQISIAKGEYRPNMNGTRPLENMNLPTPWNELEVGMGLMHGLPILLIKHDNIETGVFDKEISEVFVFTIPASTDIQRIDDNKNFKAWLSRI